MIDKVWSKEDYKRLQITFFINKNSTLRLAMKAKRFDVEIPGIVPSGSVTSYVSKVLIEAIK